MQAPDRDNVREFVGERHQQLAVREEAAILADPVAIADTAVRLVTRHIRGLEFCVDREELLQTAELAGLLFYALDRYGCTFEDLCNLASFEVAKTVATLTPDHRLPHPKRVTTWLSQVGQAPLHVKLVKLAEAAAVLAQLEALPPYAFQARARDVEHWQAYLDAALPSLRDTFSHSAFVLEAVDTVARVNVRVAARLKVKPLPAMPARGRRTPSLAKPRAPRRRQGWSLT